MIVEGNEAGLARYLEASAGLGAALTRNIAKVTEPALRERLGKAIEALAAKRGEPGARKGRRGEGRP